MAAALTGLAKASQPTGNVSHAQVPFPHKCIRTTVRFGVHAVNKLQQNDAGKGWMVDFET